MNEFVNDFDIWQDALRKINMNEQVLPIYNGRMLYEHARTYMQMQKILDCEPMQKSHKFCLNIDPESPTEEEVKKVDELYRLGVDRGFIEDDIDDVDDEVDGAVNDGYSADNSTSNDVFNGEVKTYDNTFDKPKTNMPLSPSYRPKYTSRVPSYTIMYSATKDGLTKTGETYSNAVNPSAAKADALAKLSKVGYDNISILAIECGDPDVCGFDNAYTLDDDIMRLSVKCVNSDKSECDTEMNETELDEVPNDDYLHNSATGAMKSNNRFRNTDEVYEGVLGALGGAALGSAVGAVGGGMVGNPDKVATLNNTKFEVNPTSNGNIANSLTVDGTGVKGALKFNSTGAAVGAGAGALAGGALGAMATSDDNKNESEITDTTSKIVSDILGEYENEDASKENVEKPAAEVKDGKDDGKSTNNDDSDSKNNDDNSDDESFSFEIPDDNATDPDDDIQTDDSDDGSTDETAPGNLAGSEGSGASESNDSDENKANDAESSSKDDDQDSIDGDGSDSSLHSDDNKADDSGNEQDGEESGSTELDANKKAEYKDQFTKAFKNVMLKCDFKGKKFDDLTMQEMTQVYASLIPVWGSKPDPKEFMSDNELDQLHSITIEA